ncbi:MAG: hypothetical protein HN553_02600 [Opitutae bacterium]|nr:hypothetical protein [Opitutae bacterium]
MRKPHHPLDKSLYYCEEEAIASRDTDDFSFHFLVLSGSPPALSPRDDKSDGKEVCDSVTIRSLLLRGGQLSDAAIHRISYNSFGLFIPLLFHNRSLRATPLR